VLRRAVRAGELPENPVRRVDKPRIDRRGKVRFLDQAEESRLRDALKARDEEMQNRRTAAKAAQGLAASADALWRSSDARRTAIYEHGTAAR
jgi:hypothetical protein